VRLAGLAAAVLAGGLLSGCGVSEQQLRPGVAAQVGDTTVTLDEVEDAVEVACGYFVDEGQPGFPRSLARQQFVNLLVQGAAAEQALGDAGLSVGPDDLRAADAEIAATNEQVPAARRAPFLLLAETGAFVDAAAVELGRAAYEEEGEVPTDPAVLSQRGGAELASWFEENDVEVNPVFRLTVEEGRLVADTGTSVASSDFAAATLLDPLTATPEQVAAVADRLPASQLCGASPEA
jgi:hypothetical protein